MICVGSEIDQQSTRPRAPHAKTGRTLPRCHRHELMTTAGTCPHHLQKVYPQTETFSNCRGE